MSGESNGTSPHAVGAWQRGGEKDRARADQAALLGTGLAAVIAVSFGPGSWGWWSTGVGVALLLVIFAYYRIPNRTVRWWERARELLALAAIAGYCGTLVLAYPVQTWSRDHRLVEGQTVQQFCRSLGAAAGFKASDEIKSLTDGNAREAARFDAEDKSRDECLGRYGGVYVTQVGFALAAYIFLVAFAYSFLKPPPGQGEPRQRLDTASTASHR
jgi:hypothetical protein